MSFIRGETVDGLGAHSAPRAEGFWARASFVEHGRGTMGTGRDWRGAQHFFGRPAGSCILG